MEFKEYMHIEKWGREEVEGIELGTCYVFPKIDGTNASIWLDKNQKVQCGSRTRWLAEGQNDNANFRHAVNNEIQFEGIKRCLIENPNLRFYGEWLCLSGDTIIRKVSGGKKTNYMTLREMYKYSQSAIKEKLQYISKKTGINSYTTRESWWKRYGFPSIFSLFIKEDKIKPNKINNIIFTGNKEVYEITTRKGFKIKASKEHPFFTPNGFIALKDLKINMCVAITSLSNFGKKKRTYGKGTNNIFKLQDKYKKSIGKCEICGLMTCLEIHHKDGNHKNNKIKNFQVLCRECHTKIEPPKFKGFVYDYEFDKIIDIQYIGIEDCYDISMEGTENEANFVANGFIVHNCPHTLKTYRKDAWKKFYVFDVTWTEYTLDGTIYEKYLNYDEYKILCDKYGIEYIPCIAIIKNGTYENFIKVTEQNNYLIEDGKGTGEGIVIKNYNFRNKWGRTIWAKIVTSEFKEKHCKEMGAPEYENKIIEDDIIEKYCTKTLIDKTYAKIAIDGWKSKFVPRLLETVYHDMVVEDIYSIIKEFNSPKIDFKKLRYFTIQKIKQLKPELF